MDDLRKADVSVRQGHPARPYLYRRWREGGRQRKAYVLVRDLSGLLAELERRRELMPKPTEMKRQLKELRHAK